MILVINQEGVLINLDHMIDLTISKNTSKLYEQYDLIMTLSSSGDKPYRILWTSHFKQEVADKLEALISYLIYHSDEPMQVIHMEYMSMKSRLSDA